VRVTALTFPRWMACPVPLSVVYHRARFRETVTGSTLAQANSGTNWPGLARVRPFYFLGLSFEKYQMANAMSTAAVPKLRKGPRSNQNFIGGPVLFVSYGMMVGTRSHQRTKKKTSAIISHLAIWKRSQSRLLASRDAARLKQ